jgi:polar amino acid transport system ATP-binding protein
MTMMADNDNVSFWGEVTDRVAFVGDGLLVDGPRERVIGDQAHERTRRFFARVLEPAAAKLPTCRTARAARTP